MKQAICTSMILAMSMMASALRAMPPPAQQSIADQSLADAVEDAYARDGVVDVNRINVTSLDGILQLTGSVDNILSRDRATYIAELVKGVRAVSNRIVVRPAIPRSDHEIRGSVYAALTASPATDPYSINVAVENGAVTLSGTVDSFSRKYLAAKVASSATGVRGLTNNITVDYGSSRPETVILPEVQQRLRWDALVDDGLIEVKVEKGTVFLTGTVGSAAEKRRARWDAWVAGVEKVDDSKLEVKWWAAEGQLREGKYVVKPDDQIQKAIKDAAKYDPRVLSSNIEPQVKNGVATLRGGVETLEAKNAAEALARGTVGVTSVVNRLKVNTKGYSDDSQIRKNVESALASNPYTSRDQIQVKVWDGNVRLSGVVDSNFERVEAVRVASAVRGVTATQSHLEVAQQHSELWKEPYFPWLGPVSPMGPSPRSDYQIRKDIESELWWSPFVDADQVNVEVVDGVAKLSGTVDSWREYFAAQSNAREGGAVRVENSLHVK